MNNVTHWPPATRSSRRIGGTSGHCWPSVILHWTSRCVPPLTSPLLDKGPYLEATPPYAPARPPLTRSRGSCTPFLGLDGEALPQIDRCTCIKPQSARFRRAQYR